KWRRSSVPPSPARCPPKRPSPRSRKRCRVSSNRVRRPRA
ncbi:MAG: hypothetical protein AVDCRST_MAG55-1677, partial [uncultured Rubrobacteraceae bacterium]